MNEERPLARVVDAHAATRPDAAAYLGEAGVLSWAMVASCADRLAIALQALGLAVGDRVGVLLPDGACVHIAFLALEKAGLVIVGLGARAGEGELRHLLTLTGTTVLVSAGEHRGESTQELVDALRKDGVALRHHVVLPDDFPRGPLDWVEETIEVDGQARALPASPAEPVEGPIGTQDLFLLNSTSGTTGMPKCVQHDQRRWLAFHEFAVEAGALDSRDVFMSLVPAPFGFGLWTAHFSPILLGAPTVLMARYDTDAALRLIERERVSVLAAVSTQFIMMLESDALESCDLSSLRVLFTGGEAVPRERAAAFEERTGARVLQFYGSNEVGAVSRTTLHDTRDKRLSTAGRVIPEMNVRLFDEHGSDVTASGRGRPGCRGPTLSAGYYGDDAANETLRTADGWMLLGDIVEIDDEGYLTVVGRTDDFIIRGGKNISAAAVEEACATHDSIILAAAVAMPDDVYGERVCVYVELRPGATLTLEELVSHLRARGSSVESLPEHLVVLDALPRVSGGKVAKGWLREDVRRRASVTPDTRVS